MRLLAALLIAVGSFAWLLLSVPTNMERALHEFHVFVPFTFILGILGTFRALREAWKHGWRDATEGLLTMSLLAMAWGHDAGRAQVRRAAQLAGFPDAVALETNNYRLVSGALIILAALLVIRWLTRPKMGELGWSSLMLAWTAFFVWEDGLIMQALVGLYQAFSA